MEKKLTKDAIGDRFKRNYEDVWKIRLPRRLPMIIRLDGKAFHSLTLNMNKPFDNTFIECMIKTCQELLKEIAGAKFAYTQSDEISLLVHDYNKLNTEPWFGKEIQKICSVSASIASVTFTKYLCKVGYFDARCFVLPENEVNNYFVWRQKDWTRNSIQMMGQYHFSHKQLQNKSCKEIIEMLFNNDTPWEELEYRLKNGVYMIKNQSEIIDGIKFSNSPEFINNLLTVKE